MTHHAASDAISFATGPRAARGRVFLARLEPEPVWSLPSQSCRQPDCSTLVLRITSGFCEKHLDGSPYAVKVRDQLEALVTLWCVRS